MNSQDGLGQRQQHRGRRHDSSFQGCGFELGLCCWHRARDKDEKSDPRAQQSMIKFIAKIVVNLSTFKAAAKLVLFFNQGILKGEVSLYL